MPYVPREPEEFELKTNREAVCPYCGYNDEKLAKFCKHYMETEPCGKSKVFACNVPNIPGEWRREEIG